MMDTMFGRESSNMEGRSCPVRAGKTMVNTLMEAIKQIQLTKKYLQLNCVEVKSSVHSSVSRLLESLRSREVWLLNQADVVCQAKEGVLREQEDRLNQVLGGLTNCLHLLQTGTATDEDIICHLDKIDKMEMHPLESPHLTFRADMCAMRDAIHGFGRLDSKGLSVHMEPVAHSTASTSTSLPRQFEDYEDEEHQVLYKTVSDVQGAAYGQIVINIPKLPESKTVPSIVAAGIQRQSSSDTKSGKMSLSAVPACGIGSDYLRSSQSTGFLQKYLDKEMGSCPSTSNSIRQWLSDLNVDDSGEEEDGQTLQAVDSKLIADVRPGHVQLSEQHDNRDDKVKIEFEALRKIYQRPLNDWLLKACAVIGQNNEKLSTKTKMTLATFTKVMTSPCSDWIHGPSGSLPAQGTSKSPSGSVFGSLLPAGRRPERRWLLCSEKIRQTKENNIKIRKEKEMKVKNERIEYPASPVSGYVAKLNNQSMESWLVPGFNVSGSHFDDQQFFIGEESSVMAGCMRRMCSYPSVHWLDKSMDRLSLTNEQLGEKYGINNNKCSPTGGVNPLVRSMSDQMILTQNTVNPLRSVERSNISECLSSFCNISDNASSTASKNHGTSRESSPYIEGSNPTVAEVERKRGLSITTSSLGDQVFKRVKQQESDSWLLV